MKEDNETDHKNLIIFKTLTRFISELNQSYGKTHHSLQLYNRLIEKTAVVHTDAIQRHINELNTFCSENRDAIVQQDISLLTKKNIQYSEKVYVNISDIFQNADADDMIIIWKYITCIAIQFDSTVRSDRDAFKKTMIIHKNNSSENSSDNSSENSSDNSSENSGENSSEADFLENMAKKVSENVDENDDPMKAVGNIISSGVFTEMITDMNNGLQSGDLNLGKLMGSVQKMASQVKPEDTARQVDAPDLSNMMQQMTNMMGHLSKQM